MKAIVALSLLVLTAGAAAAGNTFTLQNDGNRASITQSGDPADTVRSVERSPGHVRIEQRNGSNSTTITQDGPGSNAADPDEDMSPDGGE